MNTKINTNSFMNKTLLLLIVFASIISLLYISQARLLNWYYERYKIKSVEEIATNIKKQDNLEEYLENISESSDLCIEVFDGEEHEIYNEHAKGCMFRGPNSKITSLMEDMYNSKKNKEFYTIINPEFKSKSLLYGIRLSDGKYVFINGQLESLDQASRLITKQSSYIIVVIIVLSILIAVFISNSITKPIREITEKAKKMGEGDLNVEFKHNPIKEIDDLSETLNYAKEEMIKTDDYRRDLMANVGHDLKTPLTLIKSYAEMVRDISYKDEEKRNKHLNVIINESDRLNVLVTDILTLSKLEASESSLEIKSYDLCKQIKDIISKFEILELTENYHFNIQIPKKAIINADENKINQVIYNLINNAINYTGEDLTVKIKVKEEKTGYKVEIIDSGKGIDKKDIKHVWNRYYKTDKKHRRNKVGTGLGLSIVKEILDKHGFKYGVKSEIGKGTNFWFIAKK